MNKQHGTLSRIVDDAIEQHGKLRSIPVAADLLRDLLDQAAEAVRLRERLDNLYELAHPDEVIP